MTFDEIQVGDTFVNSNGNLTTVIAKSLKGLNCNTNMVPFYPISKKEFERRTESGLYTNFKSANKQESWKCGPLDREHAMILIKHMGASGITTTKSNNYFYFDGKNDFGRYIRGVKGPARDYFFESKLPQKFLDSILRNDLAKKDIDLTNTKIGPLTPQESEIIQRYAFTQGFKWSGCSEEKIYHINHRYLYFTKFKYITMGDRDITFKQHSNKEIDKQLILNINNEKRTEINTKYRRQEGGTAISSNSPRKVAVASRLIGNAISNRVKTTRIGRFEISKHAISC